MQANKYRGTFFILTLFGCIWGAPSALAAVVDLNPIADAFVTSAQPNSNYGGAGGLSVAAPGLPQGEFQSVLRFDASSAKSAFDAAYGPGNWTIQSAVLRLSAAAPNNPIFDASAAGQFSVGWMQNDAWTEGVGTPSAPSSTGIMFATLPSFLGAADETLGTFSFNGATTGTVSYTLNLTPGFDADMVAGSAVSLRMFAADAAVSYLMRSREFTTASNRPFLSITAVPEPAAVGLLVAGLVFSRHRRRAG